MELTELASRGIFDDAKVAAVILEMFITRMLNVEIQRELLLETFTPGETLRKAPTFEREREHQLLIQTINPVKQEPVAAIQLRRDRAWSNQSSNCFLCGGGSLQGRNDVCKAKNATCNIYGELGHFNRVCKQPK